MDSGVARRQVNIDEYKDHIERILGPTRRIVRKLRKGIAAGSTKAKRKPNILLPHGHDPRVIKAAAQIVYDGDVDITLLGSHKHISSVSQGLGFQSFSDNITIINPLKDDRITQSADQLFELRQRKGVSKSIALEALRNNNYFGAMLLHNGVVDGMLNGLIEPYAASVRPILEVLGTSSVTLAGTQMIIYKKKLWQYLFSAGCLA